MQNKIFRKASVERLSSPEQLDQLMQVTTARGWIALGALVGLLAIAVTWSLVGSIPTRVHGTGVLIKTGGVYDIVPLAAGQLSDIAVRPGDFVREGQVVARIDQPMLVDQIKKVRTRLSEMREHHAELVRFGSEDARLQADLERQQREHLERAIAGTTEQVGWLQEKVESQNTLLDEGLITRQAVLATRQQLQSTKERAEQLANELKQLSIRELSIENQRQQEIAASQFQISELEREMHQLEDQLVLQTEVTSRYTGRILEVMAQVGTLVAPGAPIVRLDRVGGDVQDLEAVLYVPGIDGKKVKAGMNVQVSPTMVKREQHGFIEGQVMRVSDFPATPEGMTRVLKNHQLVQVLAGGSAPYETYVSLKLDPATASGYKWSSSRGPDMLIQSGTICTATITIRKQRPAEMVLPALRKFFGV